MKENTHPEYHKVTVTCLTCGNTFETGSTLKEIRVDTNGYKINYKKLTIFGPCYISS